MAWKIQPTIQTVNFVLCTKIIYNYKFFTISRADCLFRYSLNKTGTGTWTEINIMSNNSHCNLNSTGTTHRDYYKFPHKFTMWGVKWLGKPFTKFPVPFKFPPKLQWGFNIIYSQPIFPVTVPFKLCLNKARRVLTNNFVCI